MQCMLKVMEDILVVHARNGVSVILQLLRDLFVQSNIVAFDSNRRLLGPIMWQMDDFFYLIEDG